MTAHFANARTSWTYGLRTKRSFEYEWQVGLLVKIDGIVNRDALEWTISRVCERPNQ